MQYFHLTKEESWKWHGGNPIKKKFSLKMTELVIKRLKFLDGALPQVRS